MQSFVGQTLDVLDTPQAVIDLDVVDANLRTLLLRYEEASHRHSCPLQVAKMREFSDVSGRARRQIISLREAE